MVPWSRLQGLAFAHFDTEGHELTILRGMQRVVAQSRPLFYVEAYPRSSKRAYSQLQQFIHDMNYTMYEVREVCGLPTDCRNFICVPVELRHAAKRATLCAENGQDTLVPCLTCA